VLRSCAPFQNQELTMKTTMTFATVLTIALLSGGCAQMRSMMPGDTGASSSAGSYERYATGAGGITMPDPAGSATYGTGSASGSDRQQEEAFSTGAGLD
jgi:hypothetical protein